MAADIILSHFQNWHKRRFSDTASQWVQHDGRARHVCFGEGEEEGRISLEQNVKKQLIFKGPTTDLKEILGGKEVTWAKAITVYFYLGSNSRVH